jgi:hypothetical protein
LSRSQNFGAFSLIIDIAKGTGRRVLQRSPAMEGVWCVTINKRNKEEGCGNRELHGRLELQGRKRNFEEEKL